MTPWSSNQLQRDTAFAIGRLRANACGRGQASLQGDRHPRRSLELLRRAVQKTRAVGVSLGSGGSGSCGLNEAERARVYSLRTLDVCTYHDSWGASRARAGSGQRHSTPDHECRALNKPTYAGEVGVTVDPSPAVLKPP
jgi:hypothetical protein